MHRDESLSNFGLNNYIWVKGNFACASAVKFPIFFCPLTYTSRLSFFIPGAIAVQLGKQGMEIMD